MLLQSPGLHKASQASYLSDVSVYSAFTSLPCASSNVYLALILFSNSISLNSHHHDGEEPIVGNSEPFGFDTEGNTRQETRTF